MNIYVVRLPMLDREKSKKYREKHLQYLKEMREAGHILMNGPFKDGSGGMVVYRAHSMEEAISFVEKDPYIVKGARTYEVKEWDVTWNDSIIKREYETY